MCRSARLREFPLKCSGRNDSFLSSTRSEVGESSCVTGESRGKFLLETLFSGTKPLKRTLEIRGHGSTTFDLDNKDRHVGVSRYTKVKEPPLRVNVL